jgi:Domain of unknown function (DUF4397)
MNRALRTIVTVATVGLAVACQKDDMPIKTTSGGESNVSPPADSAGARNHSLVRVVNAVSDGKDAGVRLGDSALFNDVKAGSVTDYREISTNLARFSVRTDGAADGIMLARDDQLLMDGTRYTIFLVAEDVSKNTLRVVKDDVIPDSGKARIRVIHAAPGAPELDVSVVGTKGNLFSGVNFKSEAGYKDVDPAAVTLELRAKDQTKLLLRLPRITLKRGTSTTVVITGASKLHSFTFTDALMAPAPKA